MKKRGSHVIEASIIITIIILVITVLTMYALNLIMPFIYYQKIDAIATKYMFIIEKFGYLTESEKLYLLEELSQSGIDKSSIILEYPKVKKEYGSLIYLNIIYRYKLNFPSFINGSFSVEKRETNISIKKSSFSKVY